MVLFRTPVSPRAYGMNLPAAYPTCAVSAADQFARDILPAVNAIRNAGTTSLQGISNALNKQGIRTTRGKHWHVSSVANLLARANLLAETRR